MAGMCFDDILVLNIGEFGRWQKFLVAILGTHGVLAVLLCMDMAFTAGRMDSWCHVPQPPTWTLSRDAWLNYTIPWERHRGGWRRDQCHVNLQNVSSFVNSTYVLHTAEGEQWLGDNGSTEVNSTFAECVEYEYDYSTFHSTIVSEWNLVCEKGYLVSFTKAVVMAGLMIGTAIGGVLADRFGRKRLAVIAIPLVVMAKIIIIFSPNLIVYNIFNFLAVAGGAVSYLVIFTLSVELVGPSWRAVAGTMICEFYAAAFLLLSLLGFLLPLWRLLVIANTVVIIVIMSTIFMIPESPRWLMSKGNLGDARKVLRRIGRLNGCALRESILLAVDKSVRSTPERVWHLWCSKTLLLQGFCIFFGWFTVAMTYYVMALRMATWSNSIHMSMTISGCVEFFAYLICQGLLSSCWGRRITTSGAYFLSGIALLFTIAIPQDMPLLATSLTMLARFSVCCAYDCIYIWTAELLPTGLRTTGISLYSCLGKLGGILGLFIEPLATIHPVIPIVIMGSITLVCGFLLLLLPETRGKKLPQTMTSVPTRNGSPDDIPNLVPGIQEHFRNVFGVTVQLISMEQRTNVPPGSGKLCRGISSATVHTPQRKHKVLSPICVKSKKLEGFSGRPSFAI